MVTVYHCLLGAILWSVITPTAAITSNDGLYHVLTPEDALWAARTVSWETYSSNHPSAGDTDAEDVLWTITQRYARWHGQGKTFDFIHSTRTFSQPLSPKWSSPEASGCKANPSLCTDAILARRKEARTATWADLEERDRERGTRVVETVRRWARGDLPNPLQRSTNFAQPGVASSHMEKNPSSQIVAKRGGHWYIADSPATRWEPNHVKVVDLGADPGAQARAAWQRFAHRFLKTFTLDWWTA